MNIAQCPQCGGKVRSESIGWTCESCQGFIDMQGGFHPHREEPFMSSVIKMGTHAADARLSDTATLDTPEWRTGSSSQRKRTLDGH